MVLILLSTIPPSLTPTSAISSSNSPFFAILSPLFDKDDASPVQPISSAAAAPASAELAHAPATAPAAFSGSGSGRMHRVPALKPAPHPARAIGRGMPPLSPANVDKMLPPVPGDAAAAAVNSPARPSPLQYSRTFSHRTANDGGSEAGMDRQRFRSVPSVHVSAAPSLAKGLGTPTMVGTFPAPPHSSSVPNVKSPALLQRSRSSSTRTSSSSSSAMASPALSSPRSPVRRRAPATFFVENENAANKTHVSLAMSGVDLEIPIPPPSSSSSCFPLWSPRTPATPHTAASALFQYGSGSSSGPRTPAKVSEMTPTSARSVPTAASSPAVFDDGMDWMEVPLTIDSFLMPSPNVAASATSPASVVSGSSSSSTATATTASTASISPRAIVATSSSGAGNTTTPAAVPATTGGIVSHLPSFTDKDLPPAPTLEPVPVRCRHRKAASSVSSLGLPNNSMATSARRGTVFQPLAEIGRPICA